MKLGGFNLQELMSQAKKQYETLQQKMQETVVEASSGGGSVTVKMDGRKQVLSIKIDPETVKAGDLEMLEDLVTAVLGVDSARGDKVAVANLSFQTLPLEPPTRPSLSDRVVPVVNKWITLVRYGALLLLFLLVYLLILRPIKKQFVTTFHNLPRQLEMNTAAAALKASGMNVSLTGKGGGAGEGEETLPSELGESLSEVRKAVLVKKNLLEKAKKEPANFSRLIQNWLRQETKV